MIRQVKKKIFASIALLSIELIIVLMLFVLSMITLAYIINYIFESKGTSFDTHAFQLVSPYISEANTRIMRVVTLFATSQFLVPANILLALYFLFFRKHNWYSIRVPVVSLGSFIVMWSLKQYFGRVRPDDPVYKAALGFSFPSGHAMSAMTFYGLLIYMLWRYVENVAVKWTLTTLLAIFILLIGFSRIYLRVHYASDVLGGFSLGIIWLVLSLWIIHHIEKYTKRHVAPEVDAT